MISAITRTLNDLPSLTAPLAKYVVDDLNHGRIAAGQECLAYRDSGCI
ncbi:unnamed protein product [Periconia digitata]|uniref:Uncharacterized protein n=1 Tax=Periconia digitata TaxID=1303443 RepID=A0A9W4U2Y3_9PLEO|nr:unnamed protein product [Periconia digitata]